MHWPRKNGAEAPVSYATGDDGGTYRVFFTLLKQQGGELITDGEVLAGDNLEKGRQGHRDHDQVARAGMAAGTG
ncbi:hypothetical protein QW131_30355 [Roseibium salinum]|nr:hypothetical protein [Roseibium salinum]